MANEANLIPQAHELTVEEQSKGGTASGKARREKKTIQRILGDFLELNVTENKNLEKLAKKAGLESDASIKELVTAICILNTLKKGDISELEKVAKLLGEQAQPYDAEADKQQAFLDAIKKAVEDGD